MKRKTKRIFSGILTVVIILGLYFAKTQFYDKQGKNPPASNNSNSYNELKVHYIDVGQGDSCFIECPNGETLLIDGGEAKYGETVSNYIASLGYSTVDYVVATHADADHIGGLYKVFEDFDVENCLTSFVPSKTKTYEKFCKAVEDEGIPLEKPTKNDMIIDEDNFDIEVVGPDTNKSYKDTNDASVVLLISYFDNDFLFTGDATAGVLKSYNIGDIEVLKASHHGSRTGISKTLANELSPEYTVISVGAKNKYNHPHKETLELLKNSKIYKTSDCGTITAICDKDTIEFSTELEAS